MVQKIFAVGQKFQTQNPKSKCQTKTQIPNSESQGTITYFLTLGLGILLKIGI
jgi:hypothetical protein